MTVYGSGDLLADERIRPRTDLGAYAAAQAEAEAAIADHSNAVILRPGCEYGPGCPHWSTRIALLLEAHRLGDLGAAGDGICNLIFLDDLAAAVLSALRHPGIGGEIFNIAMRSPPTWNDYLIRFGIALGAVPIRRITARRLNLESRLLAPPLRVMEILAGRRSGRPRLAVPQITSSLLKLCRQRITLDVAKAEAMLGMKWTALDQGIACAAAARLHRGGVAR